MIPNSYSFDLSYGQKILQKQTKKTNDESDCIFQNGLRFGQDI